MIVRLGTNEINNYPFENSTDKVKEKLTELSDEEIEEKYENKLEAFLEDLDIQVEAYQKALKISERGQMVVLKRTLKERYVNNYNKL